MTADYGHPPRLVAVGSVRNGRAIIRVLDGDALMPTGTRWLVSAQYVRLRPSTTVELPEPAAPDLVLTPCEICRGSGRVEDGHHTAPYMTACRSCGGQGLVRVVTYG